MQSFVSRFNHFRCGSQRCDCSKTSSMHYISLLKVLFTTMTNQNLSYGVFVKQGDLLGTLISNNTLRGPRKVWNCNQGPIKKKKKKYQLATNKINSSLRIDANLFIFPAGSFAFSVYTARTTDLFRIVTSFIRWNIKSFFLFVARPKWRSENNKPRKQN